MKLCFLLISVSVCSVNAYPYHEYHSLELRPWFRTKSKELMKRDLLGDVKTHTYTLDRQMHTCIMRELIEEEMTKDNLKLVISFVSRQQEDFLYHGYLKIHEVIEKKSLGDYALFQLAYQVKKDIYRGHVMPLLAIFPLAVWSVVTSGTVCIKNRGFGEYFYAADANVKHDSERRNVFTWVQHNEVGKKGDWKFQHLEGNHFHIVNSRFDEHLYAEGDEHNFDRERRRIFTWMADSTAGLKGDVWALEMDGEDVFIKNVYYNEYMYTLDGSQYDSFRRRVLTWIPKGRDSCDSDSHQCRWMISIC